jgi:hypothetical protein
MWGTADIFDRLAAGEKTEYVIESDSDTVTLHASVPDGQTHKIEIYNPLGVLVGASLPLPGRAAVTVQAELVGNYTVRVKNISEKATYAKITLARSDKWLL